jgi:DNA-binding transcriptional ArsR family regulator
MKNEAKMSYVYDIKLTAMTFHKTNLFDSDLQEIAILSKILSHPARLAILRHLANSDTCISGDISSEIPLSRTTVSQHLQELKRAGLIHGEIEGTRVCYCICKESIQKVKSLFNKFILEIEASSANSCTPENTSHKKAEKIN